MFSGFSPMNGKSKLESQHFVCSGDRLKKMPNTTKGAFGKLLIIPQSHKHKVMSVKESKKDILLIQNVFQTSPKNHH
jgi:hypothetical protein